MKKIAAKIQNNESKIQEINKKHSNNIYNLNQKMCNDDENLKNNNLEDY